ncbi:MAG: 50S ribosomal protein L23 [Parachlamydiales bacterium]
MKSKSPYSILLHRRVTEKAKVLEGLESAESNPSLARCKSPKVVFVVDPRSNKQEIAAAVEAAYPHVKVRGVNTINVPKKERRVRGRVGFKSGLKKAIVTLSEGDQLER